MNPVVIAAGIYLSAKIISFIAGESTEADIQKQKEIDAEIEAIRERYYTAETEAEIKEAAWNSDAIVEKRRIMCSFLKSEAASRESDVDSLYDDIRESKRRVIATLRAEDVIQTPLRRTSLELLLRQLSEAQEKAFAYKNYLEIYQEEVGRNHDDEEPAIFLWQLPKAFPYVGKVIWIDSDQLLARSIEYEIPGLSKISISVSDRGSFEYVDHCLLPIMITEGRKKSYCASAEKGAFKAYELPNTHLGVAAVVKEIQRNHIILVYQNNLELFLPRDNLIKPDRFPPIRSMLTVYPVKWEYNLAHFSYPNGGTGYPVTVSERIEDAGSSLAFRSFPICFEEHDLKLFMEYYEANRLQDYDEEFLIGPVEQKDVLLQKGTLLKLQFGDIPLFYIEIDEHSARSDILRYYFRFHHMCEKGEKTFSADDIFLPFDVSFTPYYAGTSEEMIQQYMDIDDLDDVAALIWDVFEEFRIQDQIRKDREGMGYFFKWENITNQLISVLEQGDSVFLQVKWEDVGKRNCVFADILTPAVLESFIQTFAAKTDILLSHEWRPQFFVKDEADNRYITTVLDAGQRLRIIGRNASEVFLDSTDTLELFASNRPYAEYQQKAALRRFRIGQVVNPVIQAACLNSKNIISSFQDDKELAPLHNELLKNNESQKYSVEHAFREKNIFLIQGPPGTGKTTVIRELVEQVLEADSDSRVLIVSQANVAVDNALSGLIEKYADQTVRCGNGNKISAEFQKLRLQNRCQDYLSELDSRREDYEKGFYESWEETLLSGEDYDYSPVLCELIIRSHRLIGATCVGLARKNIGLERTEFDLLIIDEAGKALPAELLIPLVRAKKAVIIGDQRQLPPVINPILYDEERIDLEERAISENDLFCHSFFERLYDNAPDSCKIMLDTQFRMPAVIGTAISKLFYDGRLKNGNGTENRAPVLFNSNLTFINYDGDRSYRENKNAYKQISNDVEAKAVVSLVMKVREVDKDCKIAVITPYKGQKRLISNTLIRSGIRYKLDNIYVDTIDSFQGSEADVVLFCTTRAVNPTLFFKDTRRLNVALSRARRELIILGRLGYFYKYKRNESCLPGLADYIKKNGSVVPATQCAFFRNTKTKTKSKELLLAIEDISIPSRYYLEEIDDLEIQSKIEEYYNNGDFLQPILVEKTSSGYLLKDCFTQFKAAQELNLSECLCRMI